MMFRKILPIVCAGCLTMTAGFSFAQEKPSPPKPTADDARPAETETGWQKLFREMAGNYEMCSAGNERRAYSLRSAPVLRWNQPVRGGDDGAVYLWLDSGRPAVIGTVFAWPMADGNRQVVHEMHALAAESLSAKYMGQEVWSLAKPALEFKPVPEAPVPAESAPQRLAQLRTLGREFTARSIDDKGGPWELRMLSQPLYRYELKDPTDLVDGAILAFVQGTDPEILLILEARREKKQLHWEYALGRFSDRPLVVQHNKTEVWKVPGSTFNDNRAPYFVRNIEQRKPPAATEKKEDAVDEDNP
jgi:hypothetical protein